MFAFNSARQPVTSASALGKSRISTTSRVNRPVRTMPRSMMPASISGSMLPTGNLVTFESYARGRVK